MPLDDALAGAVRHLQSLPQRALQGGDHVIACPGAQVAQGFCGGYGGWQNAMGICRFFLRFIYLRLLFAEKNFHAANEKRGILGNDSKG